MRVGLAPILSEARGKVGPDVFSSWKGVKYVRALVTPGNPRTTPQVNHRARMTTVVGWWHSIEEQIKDYTDLLVAGLPKSGFNGFVERNIQDMFDSVLTRFIPLNATVLPVADNLAGPPGAEGEINLAWSVGQATPTDKVYVMIATRTDAFRQGPMVLKTKEAVSASVGSYVLTGLVASAEYVVVLLVEHVADSSFSIARTVWATAGA